MYIGLDLGTSGVKAILLGEDDHILASQTAPLPISRPHALWSEQDPHDWWRAADQAMGALSAQHDLSGVRAVGLTGQMHGATLLDKHQRVLRPAILWNDGRSVEQCRALEYDLPRAREITGNVMMPGFTAPKLRWVRENEPDIFSLVDKVLLPKDYLRLRLTGDFATDMSDAAGTMWLDTGRRDWSDELLGACGLTRTHMPALFEGNEFTGVLLPQVAAKWGMPAVPIAAGGGDNAAGAIGIGLYRQGQAMLSLGTSGVYFAVSQGFLTNPEQGVHSFCHALPATWHLMSVMLSAASCLDWVANLTGLGNAQALLEAAAHSRADAAPVWFLPYLSGERTPHNNPNATGAFWGLTHEHGPAELARAVVEGVSFGLADGMDALHATGLRPDSITLIGGGARSAFWRQLLADVSGETLDYRTGGDVGPALGAARLARLASHPRASWADMLPALKLEARYKPDNTRHDAYLEQRRLFRRFYQQVAPLGG